MESFVWKYIALFNNKSTNLKISESDSFQIVQYLSIVSKYVMYITYNLSTSPFTYIQHKLNALNQIAEVEFIAVNELN